MQMPRDFSHISEFKLFANDEYNEIKYVFNKNSQNC